MAGKKEKIEEKLDNKLFARTYLLSPRKKFDQKGLPFGEELITLSSSINW